MESIIHRSTRATRYTGVSDIIRLGGCNLYIIPKTLSNPLLIHGYLFREICFDRSA